MLRMLRKLFRGYNEENKMEKEKREEEANRQKLVEEFRWGPQDKNNFFEEDSQTIRERILKINEKIKILLFGKTGCGKSSFGNSCRTALKDFSKPATFHHVACRGPSVSEQKAKQGLGNEQQRSCKAERNRREEEERQKNEDEKRSKVQETLIYERRQKKVTERFKQDSQTIRERILETDEKNKILPFGETGCGKSSFGNSCRTALKDFSKPATSHHVACRGPSVSKQFKSAEYGNIELTDMPGIYETEQIQSSNIEEITSGKNSFLSEITEQLQFITKREASSGENSVDCVVIVLKYDSEIPPQIKRQLDVVLSLAGKGVISCHLVLTHLDVCDPKFKRAENLSSIYDSAKVQAAVKRMSEETGFPPYAISFVKNYTTEHDANINMKQHHLKVLDRIIHSALEQNEAKKTTERQLARYEDEQRRKNEAKQRLKQEQITYYFTILVLAVAVFLYFVRFY